jgi:hypothetical protein
MAHQRPRTLWMLFSTAGVLLSLTVTRRPRYLKLSTFSSGTPLTANTISCTTRFSSSKCLFHFRSTPSWHLLVPGCIERRTKSGTNMSHLPHCGSGTGPTSIMCMMSGGKRQSVFLVHHKSALVPHTNQPDMSSQHLLVRCFGIALADNRPCPTLCGV